MWCYHGNLQSVVHFLVTSAALRLQHDDDESGDYDDDAHQDKDDDFHEEDDDDDEEEEL